MVLRDSAPADWQLPAGVDRGLWQYINSQDLAEGYDAALADCNLLEVDRQFVDRHCPSPGRLIDLGCGTGRLVVPMAQKGFQVLGVDLSLAMLQVARRKAEQVGAKVDLIQANLLNLEFLEAGRFDYATCLFSTLGMVHGLGARQEVLRQVHRLLKPDGRFVLHFHNRWFQFWDPQGRRWLVWDFLTRTVFCRRDAGDQTMPPHQLLADLTVHLFTRGELRKLVTNAGFEVVELQPLSLKRDGRLRANWWFGSFRAYGYLLAARKRHAGDGGGSVDYSATNQVKADKP